jgi:hypothetical protein
MLTVAALQFLALVSGACEQGTVVECSIPGCSYAERECVRPGFGPCTCQDPPKVVTTRLSGDYLIAGVWYAAPGPGSSTTYAAGCETGTSISTTNGQNNTFTIGASSTSSFFGYGSATYGVSYSNTWSQATTDKRDQIVAYSTDNTIPGGGFDFVDHSYDQVVLLLGPEILFAGYYTDWRGTSVHRLEWSIDASRGIVYPVEIGWLSGERPMPPDVANTLALFGITPNVYPALLDSNPFSGDLGGFSVPSPDRYECVQQVYYIPGLPNMLGFQIANTYSSATTRTTSHSYTVRLDVAGTFLDGAFKMTAGDAWTWSNSSATTNATTNKSSVKLNLRQPNLAYRGPTILNVYIDKVYKTLMYSFVLPAAGTAKCQIF